MQTDAGDTVMDETEIELRDVTQYVMRRHTASRADVSRNPLGGDYPQHDGIRPRTSGFPVARFLR